MSTAAQDPRPERRQEVQVVRLDPKDRADLVERFVKVLTAPRDDVRSAARKFLHATLQLVRFPAGHKWAALAGECGFHRISQFYLDDVLARVAIDFASSDPERHTRAKGLLEEAFGSYLLDELAQ